MSVKNRILDARGQSYGLGVNSRHAALVSLIDPVVAEIPVETLTARKQWLEFFTLDYDLSTNDMNVDGSTSTKYFYIRSEVNRVKWANSIRFILEDTNMEIDTNDFRRFGTAAAAPGLTNGISLKTWQSGVVTDFFPESVKNIGQFLETADKHLNYPNSVGTQEDWLMFEWSLDWEVALPDGSEDYLVIEIRDDLTSVDHFRALVRGYQETT